MSTTKYSPTKHLLQSKTIWANLIGFVASILPLAGVDYALDAETQAALTGGILSLVNIGLRFTTTKGLRLAR